MSSLFERIFGTRKSSANVAKDRLKIVLAHERMSSNYPFMNDLKEEILQVIKKYIKVKDINIKTEKNDSIEMLEVEVMLDEKNS